MARARNFGFFPAPGTDYSVGQEPEIARRLGSMGRALHKHLIGISGYRSPAHSVAVGGFSDDPHTRGMASDTPGTETIPEATLRRFGLTRPFPGAAEADHIQLLGSKGGTTTARPRGARPTSLAELWIQAGGPRNLAPIMSAIALAESGARVGAVGGPNNDGTYDYGLWQINSSHRQFNRARLISDPHYNAAAAVSIWRAQGLTAWSTYNSGAYRGFLGQGRTATTAPGRVRPGGDTAGGDGSDGLAEAFQKYIQEGEDTSVPTDKSGGGGFFRKGPLGIPIPNLPGLPGIGPVPFLPFNPVSTFTDTEHAIKDTADFLKWVGWIFHPRNILRVVESIVGLTLMGFGLHTWIESARGAQRESSPRRAARAVFNVTPAGRSVRVAKAARSGKRLARLEGQASEAKTARRSGYRKQVAKQRSASNEREMNRKYGGVPF